MILQVHLISHIFYGNNVWPILGFVKNTEITLRDFTVSKSSLKNIFLARMIDVQIKITNLYYGYFFK
ncbi:hypothetical protein CA834_04800 [Winogradskyella aurantia]|uniref:Uncharacterized protein n=1 Tax=Winogradskyella aurantia TaxID=1915063 RepID=A0A265UXB0_9FLAO|nr:hypothetical protein CA834_04800 [Winogradskyella aurantia]